MKPPSPGSSPTFYRPPGRPGLIQVDVDRIADRLLQAGDRPSIEKVRKELGGSPNTIARYLDDWWQRLSSRVQVGPSAFDRLPTTVAHLAESFFLQALDEARKLARAEDDRKQARVSEAETSLAVREHVLSLREAELQDRLTKAEQTQTNLERELRELRLAYRKLVAAHDLLLSRSLGESRTSARSAAKRTIRARPARRKPVRVSKRR